MPTTNLIVDGTTYTAASRKANSLVIDGWGWDLDGDFWCEFHEVHRGPASRWNGPKVVSLTVDGTTRFTGNIATIQPGVGEDGRRWAYRCLGLKNRANQIPVTATDESGVIVYNLPPTDEYYVAANAGKEIGEIVEAVLSDHSSALSAVGVTTDATTTSQLGALTLVPQDPVYITGERLWLALENAFQRYARNHRLIILPSGLVRVVDVTTGTTRTLTSGTDPVDIPQWSRDWTHCATRVVVRGKGRIRPAYVSFVAGTLVPTWDATDESNWSMDDFEKPGDAYDVGAVTTVLGPTSVRVNPTDNAKTWASNFWSGRNAWVYLRKTTGTGLTYQEAAPVTANTALTAGGTSDLTLGITLDNSGASDYDEYELIGRSAPAGTGLVNVYRLYDVVTPGGWVEEHLVPRFPAEVPFVGITGLSAQNTLTPMAQILGPSGNGYTQTFRIIPSTGQILFDRPTVEQLNTPADLAAGGGSVVQPTDIYVLLAYSRGALTAVYPPDSGGPVYSGTAYSVAGLSRTLYADVEQWLYEGNESQMTDLAQMLHTSVADTVIEGTVVYKGAYSTCYDPSGGHVISTVEPDRLAGGNVTTNVPLRSFSLRYISDGSNLLYASEMRCSSRRDPRTDESQYLHLSQFGSGMNLAGLGGAFVGVGAAVPGMLADSGTAAILAAQGGMGGAAAAAQQAMATSPDPGEASFIPDPGGWPGSPGRRRPGRRKRPRSPGAFTEPLGRGGRHITNEDFT